MRNMPEFHPFLLNQLKKLMLNADASPVDTVKWNEFLNIINRHYYDIEQEKYLLERSIDISSREMMELNNKLTSAQIIANLGYWIYDLTDKSMIWSEQTYSIIGIDPYQSIPDLDEIKKYVHQDDIGKLLTLVNMYNGDQNDFEIEFRIKSITGDEIKWVYVKGAVNTKINHDNHKYVCSISGIIMDITKKKEAEFERSDIYKKLITLTRQAGMSDVISVILHNIGNILTSVNIASSIIKERVDNGDVKKLSKLSAIIKNNYLINNYFIDDAKGKLIPGYLASLSDKLLQDNKFLSNELSEQIVNLSHIKDIVIMQNDLTNISGIISPVVLPDLLDLSVKMCFMDPSSKKIKVEKNHEYFDKISVDKNKLLQVLINLIKNAKDSLISYGSVDKVITLSTIKEPNCNDKIKIIVGDNGGGIATDQLSNIFVLGYTTKINGHGFGLHGSAAAIHEMGGEIAVMSDGVGKGAEFVIELPIK